MNIDTKAIAESLQWLGWDDDDVRRTVTQLQKGFYRVPFGVLDYDTFVTETGEPALQLTTRSRINAAYVDVIFTNKSTNRVWFSCHGNGIMQDRIGGTPYVLLPEDFDYRAIGYLAEKLATNNLVGYQMHLMRTLHYPAWSRTGKKRERAIRHDASPAHDEGMDEGHEGGQAAGDT